MLRTIAVVVFMVAAAAIAVSLLTGDDDGQGPGELPTPEVRFEASLDSYGEKQPVRDAVEAQGEEIVELLQTWYQRAFVDVEEFGDGTFPEVADLFDDGARPSFAEDVDALTIGPARAEVSRVEPEEATAAITIYFEDGKEPVYATADVRFLARGTMKQASAYPLRIEQTVRLVLSRTGDGWRVSTYYEADQEQDSIVPSPSPTAVAS